MSNLQKRQRGSNTAAKGLAHRNSTQPTHEPPTTYIKKSYLDSNFIGLFVGLLKDKINHLSNLIGCHG